MQSDPSAINPVSQPSFWENAYQSGRAGWDLGGPAPWFEDLLAGPDAPPTGRVAVVGCGRGHDALLFAAHGFDVVGFDFAPSAIEASRAAAAKRGLTAWFVQVDVFGLASDYPAAFDCVVEHACFTAIDPARRPEYAATVAGILRPGGLLLALFMVDQRPGGPPFSTSPEELHWLFDERFTFEHLAPPVRSAEQRRGREVAARLRRK